MNLFSKHFELTEKYLSKIFDACNNLYFENSLIKIPVTVIENETVNGYFKFDIDFENKILKNPRIEISKTHKRPYEALERTMLHEMFHYKVFLELTGAEIVAAFDAYNTENTDSFVGYWSLVATAIAKAKMIDVTHINFIPKNIL